MRANSRRISRIFLGLRAIDRILAQREVLIKVFKIIEICNGGIEWIIIFRFQSGVVMEWKYILLLYIRL